MARKHSKSAKKRTHRQRKHRQRAGGWGFTGNSSIPGTAGIVSNPMVYTGIGDCRATEPGYTIPTSQYGASMKGLPGMSGGKRTRRSHNRKGKTRRHRQKGGRYGFFPEGDVNPSGQAWWAGSYAPIQRIACEGTTQNPLNPTHTGSSAPPGAANPNYFYNPLKGLMSGGSQVTTGQRGGSATQMAPATYGVGNVDSMYHYSPTAGYANTASTWLDSVGAPVQIQVPFAARAMNQACLSTGGHPPLTGALQKGGYFGNNNDEGQPPQSLEIVDPETETETETENEVFPVQNTATPVRPRPNITRLRRLTEANRNIQRQVAAQREMNRRNRERIEENIIGRNGNASETPSPVPIPRNNNPTQGGRRSRKHRGGSIWNMPGQIIGNLFGNRGNGNVVDMSGANVSIPFSANVSIPPGAPVGIPNTVESNLNQAIRNNAANPFPAPQGPASVGGKRKNRKGKKSRKHSRKH